MRHCRSSDVPTSMGIPLPNTEKVFIFFQTIIKVCYYFIWTHIKYTVSLIKRLGLLIRVIIVITFTSYYFKLWLGKRLRA